MYYTVGATQDYELGTLLIDLVDPTTRALVWRGSGETAVQPLIRPDEQIREVVRAILAQYPPGSGG